MAFTGAHSPAGRAGALAGAAGDDRRVLFELRDVGLARGGRQVLDSVSAEIPAGATAIVGPSGSGKSTLLRLLNRLADPDRGTIAYRGRPLAEYDPLELRREVSLVPQLPALLDGTVESNLLYAAGARRQRARRAPLPACSPASTPSSPSATSRGSRSASSSARCWPAPSPSGPTCCCSTSRPRRSTTRPATRSRRPSPSCAASCEISLVLVSHDPEQARRLGDWVVRIEDGRAVAAGPLERVLA